MKAIRFILLFVVALTTAVTVNAQKGEKTVVFNANLHCASCKAKIEKNIPYEKGVKNLKVDMENNTISVTFKEDKNSVENLRKAIEKLDVQIKGVAGADCPKAATCDKAKEGKCPGAANCDKAKECKESCCDKGKKK